MWKQPSPCHALNIQQIQIELVKKRVKLINYLEACGRLVCVCGRKFQWTFTEILCVPPTHPQGGYSQKGIFPFLHHTTSPSCSCDEQRGFSSYGYVTTCDALCDGQNVAVLSQTERRNRCARKCCSIQCLRFAISWFYINLVFHSWCEGTIQRCQSVRGNTHAMSRSSGTVHRERGGRKWVVKCPPCPL